MTVLTITLHPAIDKVLRTSRLQPDEVSRVRVEMLYGGGKGNNVARALTRLQVPVIASGFQGGHSGAFITGELEKEGITTAFVTCEQPTRTSTLVQEEQTGFSYALYEPGQSVTEEEIELLLDRFASLLEQASLCLLCGSGQSPILASTYAKMIHIAEQKGKPCIVDSSGDALAQAIGAQPYMVKVNEHELSEYTKKPLKDLQAQIAATRDLQAQGIPVVALSRGAAGMIATDGKQLWEAQLSIANVINVVGCGDSLLAGVSKVVLENGRLEEILRWGVACGTANTQVRGAGFIERKLVEELAPQVKLREIDI